MTAAISNLSFRINDDGTASVSAADWSKDGHLWAFENQPVSIHQLRMITSILGLYAVDGLDRRLQGNRSRLVAKVKTAEARLKEVKDAQTALTAMDAEANEWGQK